MRKLIVNTFVTLDGVMQAPGTGGRSDRRFYLWRLVVQLLGRHDGQVMDESMAKPLNYYWAGRRMKSLRRTGHTLKMIRLPTN